MRRRREKVNDNDFDGDVVTPGGGDMLVIWRLCGGDMVM